MDSIRKRLHITVTAFILVFNFSIAVSAHPAMTTSKTLDRNDDPAIVTGASLPEFLGVPLNQLFVYAFHKNEWRQIPWQFDEVKDELYLPVDNNKLDAVDELVVMGADCGDRITANEWINDANSHSYPRYEITVVDPLNTSKLAWFYVYRSTTLQDTVRTDYVDYHFPDNLFTSPVYKLGFMLAYIGGNRLEMNGSGIDVLDRSKYRMKPVGQQIFDEEWAEGEDPQPEILDGRVRAIAGYQGLGLLGRGILTYGYRSMFYDLIIVDLSWAPGAFEWVRASADFNENMVGGIYYDANTPKGVRVDGKPDTILTTPVVPWQQISSATGTVIHTADVSPMGGTLSMYYKDDATVDQKDTGDKKSYGDMGVTVTNPLKKIYLSVTHYILPPNLPNVGARYYEYFLHPLQCQALATAVQNAEQKQTPHAFSLSANYPNPFNPITTLQYEVGAPGRIEIVIYDVLGQKIRTLLDERKASGVFTISWDGLNQQDRPAPSGIYFCVLSADPFTITRQLVLLR